MRREGKLIWIAVGTHRRLKAISAMADRSIQDIATEILDRYLPQIELTEPDLPDEPITEATS